MKAPHDSIESFHSGESAAMASTRMESRPLSIRPAVAADAGLLKTLIHEFAAFEKLEATIDEDALLRDGFGPKPLFHALIAEWETQPAGYALFFDNYSSFHGPSLFLEDIYVRNQYRGKGIGKALFERLAVIAREQNCVSIMFNVLDWNTDAINVYRNLGAAFLDEWKVLSLEGAALRALAQSASEVLRDDPS
jgi:GNAT superfamily N-acetyltransferase